MDVFDLLASQCVFLWLFQLLIASMFVHSMVHSDPLGLHDPEEEKHFFRPNYMLSSERESFEEYLARHKGYTGMSKTH